MELISGHNLSDANGYGRSKCASNLARHAYPNESSVKSDSVNCGDEKYYYGLEKMNKISFWLHFLDLPAPLPETAIKFWLARDLLRQRKFKQPQVIFQTQPLAICLR